MPSRHPQRIRSLSDTDLALNLKAKQMTNFDHPHWNTYIKMDQIVQNLSDSTGEQP